MTGAQRGSAAVEVLVLAPLLVLLVGFIAFCGRLGAAANDVQSAAGDAARAASLRPTAAAAAAAARAAAATTLADVGLSCRSLTVDLDASRFGTAGTASVEVACVVSFADIAIAGIPGTRRVSARVAEPVDALRSDR